MAELKPFLCENRKHRLGMIRWNGDGVPQLLLYRHAVSLDVEHPADVDVIGSVEGRVPVRCDLCDEVKLWEVSVEVLLAMVRRLDEERVDEFVERLHRQRAKVAFE